MFVTPDVDECKNSEAVCSEHAQCTNTLGSFVCTCKPEYTGDARVAGGCRDIDECVTLEHPCGTHAICENAAPGYNCVCPQGYRAQPDPQVACEQVMFMTNACVGDFKSVIVYTNFSLSDGRQYIV